MILRKVLDSDEQNGLTHTSQTNQNRTLGGATGRDPLERDSSLFEHLGATR
jgi:hypothetical protein